MRVLTVLVVLGVAGCGLEPLSGPKTGVQEGQEVFEAYCTACHGDAGRGDGGMASELPVPPADLSQLAARNGGVFPTGAVMAKIYGYPGGAYGAVMPEFGPLLDGPEVMWHDPEGGAVATPKALVALAGYLEGLQAE